MQMQTLTPESIVSKEPAGYTLPFDTSNPRFPGRVQVVFGEQDFSSKLVASKTYRKGDVIAPLTGVSKSAKAWTSVQIDRDTHVELNSELVFMNHSCDPSIHIDAVEMCVVAGRDLAEGDELTFFYPSTEWDMSQPFTCWCGAADCLRRIDGSKHIPRCLLGSRYLSKHIQALLAEREASGVTDDEVLAARVKSLQQ
ncbi:hypothetical protein BC831DRAFT_460448 [Entophlyctis helioformis]|nr:hypothetical protein BC831DRAFT_460448 [Entophlyctis helioformis]